MEHRTHDKGDLAMAKVMANLIRNGFKVCLPISTHLPFDLVAVDCETGKLYKIQVKYRTAYKGALCIAVKRYSVADGVSSSKPIEKGWIDAWAVYCPDTRKVYYIKWEEIEGAKEFVIRVKLPKNNQVKNVRLGYTYTKPSRLTR